VVPLSPLQIASCFRLASAGHTHPIIAIGQCKSSDRRGMQCTTVCAVLAILPETANTKNDCVFSNAWNSLKDCRQCYISMAREYCTAQSHLRCTAQQHVNCTAQSHEHYPAPPHAQQCSTKALPIESQWVNTMAVMQHALLRSKHFHKLCQDLAKILQYLQHAWVK
jgi:hypothetical protein